MKAFIVGCGISLGVLGCGEVNSNVETDASNQVSDARVSDARSVESADAGPDAGPTCPLGAICEANVNYAFVTSTKRPASEYGGLAGADTICNDLAQAAGLPGQYAAWLSSRTQDARDRLGSASGWIRTDGRPFSLSRGDLLSGQIIHPLNLDENGAIRTVNIATNTKEDGTRRDGVSNSTGACEDWTGDSDVHEYGRSSETNRRWTQFDEGSCADDANLYCLGITYSNDIQLPEANGARRAWLSSGTLSGNVGIDVMDDLCSSEGKSLGVDSAVAFVATSTESAVDRLDLSGPTWVRSDNAILWLESMDIKTKSPMAAINISNQGELLRGPSDSSFFTWTGAQTPSTLAAPEENCQDWSLASGGGVGSYPATLLKYFLFTSRNCLAQHNIYCFEE